MKKHLLDLFGPEKTPEEIYAFATEPTEEDLDLFLTGQGYQSVEWQAWFAHYFIEHPEKQHQTVSQPEDGDTEALVQRFQEKFPNLTASLQETLQKQEQQTKRVTYIESEAESSSVFVAESAAGIQAIRAIQVGEVWSLAVPVGIFRGKPVVVVEQPGDLAREDCYIGFPVTWQSEELWYANDQDLILQPEDWDKSYPAFISTWNPQMLLKSQFQKQLGQLTPEACQALLLAFEHSRQLQIPQEQIEATVPPLQETLRRIREKQETLLQKREIPEMDFLFGKPILSEDDPRHRYALNEFKLCSYMSAPFFEKTGTAPELLSVNQTPATVISLSDFLPAPASVQEVSSEFWEWIQEAKQPLGKTYLQQLQAQNPEVTPVKMAAATEQADEDHPIEVKPLQAVAQDMEIHLNPQHSRLKLVVGGDPLIEKVQITGTPAPGYHQEWSFQKDTISLEIPFQDLKGCESLQVQVTCRVEGRITIVDYPAILLP